MTRGTAHINAPTTIRVNSGPDQPLSLAVTKQPTIPVSGIPQPLPPMFGFRFPGTPTFFPINSPVPPQGLCTGPDGLLYGCATFSSTGYLHRIAFDGTYTTTSLGACTALGICAGPDGNLWIADLTGAVIRVAPDGTGVTSFALAASNPNTVCAGPDGNLWVADTLGAVWRVTPAGTPTRFAVPAGMSGVCAGPDGNIWACGGPHLYKITTAGVATQVGPTMVSNSGGIAQGGDGNIWVNDLSGDKVYAVAPNGSTVHTITLPDGSHPYTLCSGAGGDIWVTANGTGHFYKITTAGAVTDFVLDAAARPYWVCSGGDGGLWISDTGFEGGGVWLEPFILQANGLELNSGPLKKNGVEVGTGVPPGVPTVHKFSFAYNAANLHNGISTGVIPTVDEILIDAWFEIDTAWDGTTPKADFGEFQATEGLFSIMTGDKVDMTAADAVLGIDHLLVSTTPNGLMSGAIFRGVTLGSRLRKLPARFTGTNPMRVVVSQNGQVGGGSPGATQGAATLYIVTATAI